MPNSNATYPYEYEHTHTKGLRIFILANNTDLYVRHEGNCYVRETNKHPIYFSTGKAALAYAKIVYGVPI